MMKKYCHCFLEATRKTVKLLIAQLQIQEVYHRYFLKKVLFEMIF